MGIILLVAGILLAVFGGYSWFSGELNGFQKGCYLIGLLLVISGYFLLSGPYTLLAGAVGCLLIFVPNYGIIREYMP